MDLEFEELSSDQDIVNRLTKFKESIDEIEKVLQFSKDPEFYDKLSNEDKIQFNLLMSFSLNGLFWMYLRAEGILQTQFFFFYIYQNFTKDYNQNCELNNIVLHIF